MRVEMEDTSQSVFAGYGLEVPNHVRKNFLFHESQSAFAGYGLEAMQLSHSGQLIDWSQSAFAGYGLEVFEDPPLTLLTM